MGVLQGDGNLVLKRNGEVCWASNTYGNHPTPCSLVMQESGELARELGVAVVPEFDLHCFTCVVWYWPLSCSCPAVLTLPTDM